MLESQIEKKFREMIESHGGRCYKWTSQGQAGVPDRIVLLPGGRISFVELKKPGGVVSKLQRKQMSRLEALGFCCYVVGLGGAKDIAKFEREVVGIDSTT